LTYIDILHLHDTTRINPCNRSIAD